MQTDGWEKTTGTLILNIDKKGIVPRVLVGQKQRGILTGYLTPPGGGFELYDKNLLATAHRELLEETGLCGFGERGVAKLNIRIKGSRRQIFIHVFKCTKWTGCLKMCDEFKWLKFIPISKIPWDQAVPGDRDWMEKVLAGNRLTADIICGATRHDLEKISIEIQP